MSCLATFDSIPLSSKLLPFILTLRGNFLQIVLKRTFRAENACDHISRAWFPGKFYEPDPHKVVICIELKRRPYPRKCRFARAVAVANGEFSNLWTSGWYLGFQESDLANLRLEKSDSLGVVVKFRHYCERGFESMIVGCHCRWFRVDECISGEFISLRVKKTLIHLSSLPLRYIA